MVLYEYLKQLASVSSIAAIVGDRASPLSNYQSDTVPRLAWEITQEIPQQDSPNGSELAEYTFEVSCFAKTYKAASDLAATVRDEFVASDPAMMLESSRDVRDDGTRTPSVVLSFRLLFQRG